MAQPDDRAPWQRWLDAPKADPRWEERRKFRDGFFAAIEKLTPQVLRNLAGEPFDHFRDYTRLVARGEFSPTEPARPLLWRDIASPGPADPQAVRDLREERVVKVVEQHADGLRPPARQAAGDRVRPVAEPPRRVEHARAPVRAHLRAVAHDERHERTGHSGRARHILHGRRLVSDALDSHGEPKHTAANWSAPILWSAPSGEDVRVEQRVR